MWIVTISVLFIGGALSASGIVLSLQPAARGFIERVMPFKGIVGALLLIWGVIDLVRTLQVGSALASFYGIIAVLVVFTELGLGFLLGYDLLSQYVLGKNVGAQLKGEQLRAKVGAYQGPLGLAAMGLAVFFLVLSVT